MKYKYIISFFTCITLSSCGVIQNTPKDELNDGVYTKKENGQNKNVYVDIQEDSLRVFPTTDAGKDADTGTVAVYPRVLDTSEKTMLFTRQSLDFDFLTAPLKCRLPQKEVPVQLNTPLNGSFYLGYRTDYYSVNYTKNPLKEYRRSTTHFGFSLGLFTGMGNTFISPTTTNNQQAMEYDGAVFSKGMAAIVAINQFTVGIAGGWDNLLDKNSDIWIYESKPWYGLVFGVNLN